MHCHANQRGTLFEKNRVTRKKVLQNKQNTKMSGEKSDGAGIMDKKKSPNRLVSATQLYTLFSPSSFRVSFLLSFPRRCPRRKIYLVHWTLPLCLSIICNIFLMKPILGGVAPLGKRPSKSSYLSYTTNRTSPCFLAPLQASKFASPATSSY